MGAKVAELVNQPHEAGRHTASYNTGMNNFQGGVYFVRLDVIENGRAAAQKVIRLVHIK